MQTYPVRSRRLFVASCLALVATSMAFSIRADIIPALKTDFGLTDADMGIIAGPGLWGFAITIILGGLLVDLLGMKTLLWLAFAGHVSGVVFTIFAQGYASLFFATLLIGLANGLVEAVTNPLTATLYPDQKTHHLNILHAWWPGGLILGGLAGYGLTKLLGLDASAVLPATLSLGWRLKMALILIPTAGYGLLISGQVFPPTERVASGVSYREMLLEAKRPLFLLFLVLMMLTSSTELGLDQWVGNLLQNLVGIQGVLLLVYTAGIMFLLRQFCAGTVVRAFSPLGVLTAASFLTAIGLYWLGNATTAASVFAAATVFGLGKTFFWPTMIGVVSERFPRGGALLMGLMGGAGMLSVGWIMTPLMGKLQDKYVLQALPTTIRDQVSTPSGQLDQRALIAAEQTSARPQIDAAKQFSASQTYRAVAMIPVLLTVVFAGLFLYFRAAGGYRTVRLSTDRSAILNT